MLGAASPYGSPIRSPYARYAQSLFSEKRVTRVSSGFLLNPRLNVQLGITKSVGDGYNFNNQQINSVGAEYRL